MENNFKLFIAAANLFQEAEERDAETRLCETPFGHEVTPVLWMLRYKNFDPLVVPNVNHDNM
jgi:hypothetical protein